VLERIEAKTVVIGVMGMGYVGLPLAATLHRAGFQVMVLP
jgi:UDP-N-acetyl-D-mannosaminuronate dehydrogenase